MKIGNKLPISVMLTVALFGCAQTPESNPMTRPSTTTTEKVPTPQSSTTPSTTNPATVLPSPSQSNSSELLTEGEIRKVDMGSGKVTIRHGEIKNLEMPGMTMVFQMKDPIKFQTLKMGDKVKFRAEKEGSNFVVTRVEMGQ